MARFDVYRNAAGNGYLVDLQADLLEHLNTRIVAPHLPLDRAPKPAATLNPVLLIEGKQVVMATQFMAAVPSQILKSPVAHIDTHRAEITAAIDLLFQGFFVRPRPVGARLLSPPGTTTNESANAPLNLIAPNCGHWPNDTGFARSRYSVPWLGTTRMATVTWICSSRRALRRRALPWEPS